MINGLHLSDVLLDLCEWNSLSVDSNAEFDILVVVRLNKQRLVGDLGRHDAPVSTNVLYTSLISTIDT